MKFFEDSRGNIYPIDQITAVRPLPVPADGKAPWVSHRITLRDHGQACVPESTIEYIRRASATIIAAEPGVQLLTFVYDAYPADPDFYTIREAVIAWRVDGLYTGLSPVTLNSESNEMSAREGILQPDGAVYSYEGIRFDNIEVWDAFQRREAELVRDRQKANAERLEAAE